MLDEKLVSVDELQLGDWIIADNPDTPNVLESKQVLKSTLNDDGSFELQLDDEIVTVTDKEEFWIKDEKWVQAKDLEEGDLLQTEDGDFVTVDGIEVREGTFEVFNFEVEDFHTYFVSQDGVLVHNINCVQFKGAVDLDEFDRLNVIDPANKKFKPGEASGAVELQEHFQRKLRRAVPSIDGDVDFVMEGGEKIDFLFTVDTEKNFIGINKSFGTRKGLNSARKQLIKHVNKADIVPVDFRSLTPKNQVEITKLIGQLTPQQKSKILIMQ